MHTVEIGRSGRPHGTKGELALIIKDVFLDDLEQAAAILIGSPPIPYFIQRLTGGGKLRVKLERFDSREAVALLANQPVHLPADRVSAEPETEETPYNDLIGFAIHSEGYPSLGPIRGITDLPQHYLAELEHEGREILIPLHPNLILEVDTDAGIVRMNLPTGLLELD